MAQMHNITNGDEPVDMMGEEDFDNQGLNHFDQNDQYNNQYQFQNYPQDNMNLQQQNQNQQIPTDSSFRYQLTSLQQLMGNKNPKEFAKEFVYGDQKKLAKNLEKENMSVNQVFYDGNNQFRHSDLLQRFNSPKNRDFGDEIQNTENNYEPKSIYTQYSKTLKNSFKKNEPNRFGTQPKPTEILLSPTNITAGVRRLHTQTEISVDKQKEHNQKLAREYEVLNHKKEILKEKYQNQEMRECSFTPAINRKANEEYNKNRFYEHMDKKKIEIMNKNNQKKEQLNTEISQNLKTKPEISQKTQKLAKKKQQREGYSSQSVVDRLFTQQGNKNNFNTSQNQSDYYNENNQYGNIHGEDMTVPQDPECTFKPYVSEVSTKLAENKQRYGTIDYKLFEDAKQRQLKQKQQEFLQVGNLRSSIKSQQSLMLGSQLMKSSTQQHQKSTYNQTAQNKITVNANIDRFKKEFETAYYAIVRNSDNNLVNDNNFWSQKLSYYEVVEMMKVMYFLNPSPTEDWISSHSHSSAALAQRAWVQLHGKDNNYIISRNLLVFLFAVQNINITPDQVEHINDESMNRNQFQQDNFSQDQDQHQQQQQMDNASDNQINSSQQQDEYQSHSQRISHDNIDDEGQQQIPSSRDQIQQVKQIQQIRQNNVKASDLSEHLNPDERNPEHFNDYNNQSAYNQMDPEQQKNEQLFMEKLNKIQETIKNIGQYDNQGNLYLNEQDTLEINKIYYSLYLNRLSSQKGATHYRKVSKQTAVRPDQPTGRPYISEISQQIAQNKREVILSHLKKQGAHVKIDLNTILCFQKQMADDEKQILKHQLEDEQMEGCTFKPQTKSYSSIQKFHQKNNSQYNQSLMESVKKTHQTSVNPLGVQRTQELYKLAKPQNQKRDRLKEEIEYEKECDECTFQPDILSNKKSQNPSSIMFMSQQQNTTNFQNNTYVSPMKTQLSGKPFATNSHLNDTKNSSFYQSEIKNIERVKKARVQKKVNDTVKSKGTTQNKNKLNKMSNNIYEDVSNNQRQPKIKRKAQTDQGNFVARSPNSSQMKKNTLGSSYQNQSINPNYNQYYGESLRQDTNGSLEDRNDYKGIQEKSPKMFANNNNNAGYSSVPNSGNLPNSHASSNMGSQPPSVPQTQKTAEDDKVPLLFVDVNIEEGKTARIIVYEDDNSEELATRFTQEHGLDPSMKSKLKDLLDQQINSLLTKIDEEAISDNSSDK